MSKSRGYHCSLTTEQQRIRRSRVRDDILPLVCAVNRTGNCLRLELVQASGNRELLKEFIALEQGCCGFLDFSLSEEHESLSLLVEGPPDATDLIDLFQKTLEGEHH